MHCPPWAGSNQTRHTHPQASRLYDRRLLAGTLCVHFSPKQPCCLAPTPGADADAPAIFLGSHYDTVVDGGKYDGALGIVAGISAVKALLLEVSRCSLQSLLRTWTAL